MTDRLCPSCSFALDPDDNFCRRCGAAYRRANLPVVRPASTLALWRPAVSPVVKGAVVMAAGTIGQMAIRRLVNSVLGSGKSRQSGIRMVAPRDRDGMVDEAQIITETVMMRRVRIRRQV